MFKIGLKLWSSNLNYLKPVQDLYQQKIFDYLELFIDPKSPLETVSYWQQLKIPFHCHAPHYFAGVNFSDPAYKDLNEVQVKRVEFFRQVLNPEFIIFHPGINGKLDETIRQLNFFKNQYPELFKTVLIENKPKLGLNGQVCLGASAPEIQSILQSIGCGFCLDIGHAICFAAWAKLEWEKVINDFLTLKPRVYHLSDGDHHSVIDLHEHFGAGNFDLPRILKMLPPNQGLTIETKKDSPDNLDDFKRDALYLKKILERV